ncbi:interferon regulatory factor 1-like [Pristis pectinata]|uniref:interferon regulatory factor 1-like n=1 Tax=Pristis pectinata TaxID=685728 RepID=UPI00223DAA85|nr:interferon regulatory factor 1-like [Pristis pectinata]XP_051870786.1 interferon regulatory factor 1-like [Pristis pectinata]
MPVARMRMRPWLELQIDSNKIPGLRWINKDRRIFQIPWKHAARHGWNLETDACLFRNWAVHTGRFRQGIDKPEPKTWKANFRCAMNSLPDIEEVKDKSINKGSSAIRVYRMLLVSKQKEKRNRLSKEVKSKNKKRTKSKVKEEVTEPVAMTLPTDHTTYTAPEQYTPQEMVVDSTVSIEEFSSSESLAALHHLTEWCSSGIGEECENQVASTSEMYQFQISPLPSPSTTSSPDSFLSGDEGTAELMQEVSSWEHNTIEGRGYFSNVMGTIPLSSVGSDIRPNEQDTTSNTIFQDANWSETIGDFSFRPQTDLRQGMDLLNLLEHTNWPTGALISCT